MEPRKYCVVCGTIYRPELRTCPEDGAQLLLETEPGQRHGSGHVLGSYRLGRKLGEGGVGTVYEAEHVRLGRRMAIKVLHPETATQDVVVRFFNEARAVNEIRHPNIVDVEDFVSAPNGEHYLVMELLEGEDLRSVVSRDGVVDPQRVAAIGEQIADALSAVHACGILHRDLKPDNIFLTRDANGREVAKLLDFGIAKFLGEGQGMTRDGLTLGTPEYMAPEQIVTSGKPGPQADIYALGMLMYECLAGAPAFTATTTAAILRGHIHEPVVPPSHRRGEAVPAGLEAVVMRCLEKDLGRRYADAAAVASALRAVRTGHGVTSRFRPVTIAPVGRRRVVQLLPAFAMLAAAAALHFAPRASGDAPPPAAGPVPASRPSVTATPVIEVAPAAEALPPTLQVALSSDPEGAELFLGDVSLGVAPTIAEIPSGRDAVTLTAKFSDGTQVLQTIVPDRPLPHIAFVRKGTARPGASGGAKRAAPASRPTKGPSSSGTIGDRDGTMDPFQ